MMGAYFFYFIFYSATVRFFSVLFKCLKTTVRTLFYKGKVDYYKDEIVSLYCKMTATKSPTKIPNILSHNMQSS